MSTALDVVPAAPALKRPSGLNARLVTHAVRRRPFWFAGVVLLAAGIGASLWLFLPLSKSAAGVTFQISPPQSVFLGTTGGGDLHVFRATQAGQIRRRTLLSQALNEKGIRELPTVKAEPDPVAWFEKNLKVDTKGVAPNVLKLVLEGENAPDLQSLLGALATVYLNDVVVRENGERQGRLDYLRKKVDEAQKGIEKSEQRIFNLAASVGGTTEAEHMFHDELRSPQVRKATDDLTNALMKSEASKADLARSRDRLAQFLPVPVPDNGVGPPAPPVTPPLPEHEIEATVRGNPLMANAEQAVALLRTKLEGMRRTLHPDAPALVKVERDLAAAEQRRDATRTSLRASAVGRLVEKARSDAAEEVEKAKKVADADARKEQQARRVVADLKQEQKNLLDIRAELKQEQAKIKTARAFVDENGPRIQNMAIELERLTPRITKLDEPFVISGLEGNKRLKYTLMAVFGVFVVGFGGLVGWEARSRRVTHTDDATTDLGVRLLGTVPPTGGDGQPGAPPAALAEAIDTARTMLLHGTPAGAAIRTVLVTSGVAGEGKTSLAGHLSISLARAGFRTILVDGDLQSPSAHRLFGCPVGPGLCELLRGEVDLEDAAQATPVPGLAILPAGRWDTAARQALVGDRWRRLKADLEGRYDFVVVDTAPLLLVSDTLLLAREADGVVLSVLLGVSQVAHVAESAGRLQAVGARLTGAVVNGVWHQAYRAGAAYRYAAAAPAPAGALTGEGQS